LGQPPAVAVRTMSGGVVENTLKPSEMQDQTSTLYFFLESDGMFHFFFDAKWLSNEEKGISGKNSLDFTPATHYIFRRHLSIHLLS
jgi:hypothetical protein